jgi:hypothetical protein
MKVYGSTGWWPAERSSEFSWLRSSSAVQLVTGLMRPAVMLLGWYLPVEQLELLAQIRCAIWADEYG